jgi:hypothetical protein
MRRCRRSPDGTRLRLPAAQILAQRCGHALGLLRRLSIPIIHKYALHLGGTA